MHRFKAKVIPGQGLGKRLGFPTANLAVAGLPINYGVYLVKVTLGDKIISGLLHWGPKKTFDGAVSCEIYLKDFNQDIYGRELAVETGRQLREIKKFKNVGELKAQIKKDLKEL